MYRLCYRYVKLYIRVNKEARTSAHTQTDRGCNTLPRYVNFISQHHPSHIGTNTQQLPHLHFIVAAITHTGRNVSHLYPFHGVNFTTSPPLLLQTRSSSLSCYVRASVCVSQFSTYTPPAPSPLPLIQLSATYRN